MALVYDEQMEVLASRMLAVALKDRQQRLSLMSTFSKDLFRNENYIIYTVLLQLREENIVPDSNFLNIYLHRNRDIILKDNGRFIDKSLFDSSNDFLDEVIAETIKALEQLWGTEVTDELIENLPLDKRTFKELYKSSACADILETTQLILKDSYKIGRTTLSGADDSAKYFTEEMTKISSLVSDDKQIVFDIREVDSDDLTSSPIKVGDFGDLACLNTYFGGFYTSMFYSVMAPTKGGKSKFCYRSVHNVAVQNGNNTLMWTAEGGRFKAKAELRAIHYVYYWEQVMQTPLTEDMIIDSSKILKGKYPNERVREMEEESKLDLENNENYGQIKFIDIELRINDYKSILEQNIEKYNPSLVVVDYLQYMLPAPDGVYAKMSKNERIGQSYIETLSLIKKHNVAFLTPAQMKQEAIKDLSAGKELDTRTLGGESSEIVRTPDFNIALYGTPEDIRNGHMKLLSIPSREAEPFPPQNIGVALGHSYYYSDED